MSFDIQADVLVKYHEDSSNEVVIPSNVTSIGKSAFANCESLTSIVIPNGVTSIGGGAFFRCSKLNSLVIPNGVTSIGNAAFERCSKLTSIVIPEGVTSIGGYTFEKCYNLKEVIIPDSVTSIDEHAFFDCRKLTRIVIPDNLTSIGKFAFDCTCTVLRKSQKTIIYQAVQSEQDYSLYRDSTFAEYARIIKNPFAPEEALHAKWTDIKDQLEFVLGLSSRFSETNDNVQLIKDYLETAKNKISKYSFESNYYHYRSEYVPACKEYKDLVGEFPYILEETGLVEMISKFKSFYDRFTWLYKNFDDFKEYDIDSGLITNAYRNSAYRYCRLILNLRYEKQLSDDELFAYYEKCVEVSEQFSDPRFKVLTGLARFQQLIYIQDRCGSDRNRLIGRLTFNTCLKDVTRNLSVIEDYNYCAYCAKHYSAIHYDFVGGYEWESLIDAIWALKEIWRVENSLGRAYQLTQKVLSAYNNNSIYFYLSDREYGIELEEELSRYVRDFYGNWQYVK